MTEPSPNQPHPEGPVVAHAAAVNDARQAPDLTIDLGEKERDVGQVSERKERAIVFGMYADTWSRLGMVLVMALIFIGLNWRVLSFLGDAFDADIRMLEVKPPALQPVDRLITSNVLMTLIGATVVQVGVCIAAIVSYLFPKNNNQNQ